MYVSVLALPFVMAGMGVVNLAFGPAMTRDMTHRLAEFLRARVPARQIGLEPDDMRCELRLIELCKRPPRIACLETACAFDLWLAAHGQKAEVCIGKRMEGGRIRMHAWVATEPEPFFYDGRFVEVWKKR